jgi:hypothetical protein
MLLAVSTSVMADPQLSEAKLRLLPGNLPAAGQKLLVLGG